jgi:hypothetical protein
MLLRKKEGWGWFVGFVLGWGGGGEMEGRPKISQAGMLYLPSPP